jgi:hypothetical protein
MTYKKNPFLKFWNINKNIDKNNYLNNYYNLTKYYQVLNFNNEIFLKNWLNLKIIKINKNIINLLSNYNSSDTLFSNFLNNNIFEEDFEIVFELIQNYFFLVKTKNKFELLYEEYL